MRPTPSSWKARISVDQAMKVTTTSWRARVDIDRMLEDAGWVVQDRSAINLYAATGVAVREFWSSGTRTQTFLRRNI